MKQLIVLSILTLGLSPVFLYSQDFHLELVDIVNKSTLGTRQVEKFEANGKGGSLEFSVVYARECKETYRLTWEFKEDVSYINGVNSAKTPLYYSFRTEKVDGSCGKLNPWRNPSVILGVDASGSGLLNKPGLKESFQPRGRAFNQGSKKIYFRNDGTNRPTGETSGHLIVYSADRHAGKHVHFYFSVTGASNSGRREDGIWYEVVYVFKIKKGKADLETNIHSNNGSSSKIDMGSWKVDFGKFDASPQEITSSPTADGKTSYYIAPPRFLGNLSSSRFLTFEKKSWGGDYYGPNSYAAYGDVVIKSGNKMARYDISKDHSGNWRTYTIPLSESSGWVLNGASRLREILENVTELKIRAEYGAGTDYSGLRNVEMMK